MSKPHNAGSKAAANGPRERKLAPGRGTQARKDQADAYRAERAQGVYDGFARATEGGGRLRGVGGPQLQTKIPEARFTAKRKAKAAELRAARAKRPQ